MSAYSPDPRLAADSLAVGDLDLCALRLMRDARFPWALLIPKRAGLTELFELSRSERALLMEEIAAVSEALSRIASPAKINVAALGNQVRQLHVHVIARKEDDAAWPNAVWGAGAPEAYADGADAALAAALSKALGIQANANSL